MNKERGNDPVFNGLAYVCMTFTLYVYLGHLN